MVSPAPYLAAFFCGAALAAAFSVNSRLGRALGHPLRAAAIGCGVGTCALWLLSLLSAETLPAWGPVAQAPWHVWVGGLIGASYMGSAVLLMHRLGAATIGAGQIAGQMVGSVIMDAQGWFGVPLQPIGPASITGCALVLIGVTLIGRLPRRNNALTTEQVSGRQALWVLVPVGLGLLMPVQGGINAELKIVMGGPFIASGLQFFVATASLLAVSLVLEGRGTAWRSALQGPWWIWIGGLFAATYITGVMLIITRIGAAGTLGIAVAGQQICAALIDHTGAFGFGRRAVSPTRIAGIAALLAGVAVIQLA